MRDLLGVVLLAGSAGGFGFLFGRAYESARGAR